MALAHRIAEVAEQGIEELETVRRQWAIGLAAGHEGVTEMQSHWCAEAIESLSLHLWRWTDCFTAEVELYESRKRARERRRQAAPQ